MALTEYKTKRKFSQTPEPSGRRKTAAKSKKKTPKATEPLHFVIQKHAASHLHYDFRLELDSVLKSWAVPKGPSLDPTEKRLAMQVEDHPLDYQTFEGTIPKGNYGAGTVMLWDYGTYYADPNATRAENEALLRQGLESGKLTFSLEGEKLHGEFALVRMRGNSRYPQKNSWLLIKADDDQAQSRDVLLENRSVTTQRSMDEIRLNQSTVEREQEQSVLNALPDSKMPTQIKPMLCTLVEESFDRKGWLFEIKWDGYRAVAEIDPNASTPVSLYSRNLLSFTQKFPVIHRALKQLNRTMVLDGEVVVLDDRGKPSFQLLQDYENNQQRLVYYVFDLLYLDGHDLRELPLVQRKALLERVLPEDLPQIQYAEHVETTGKAFFEAAVKQGLEGIVAKEADSPYQTGKRSRTWLKVKAHQQQEAIICGYTAPRGSRKDFGALILGAYKNGVLTYIGHTGTGMDAKTLSSLKKQFQPLITERCPFLKRPPTNQTPTWLDPQLVCEVRFTEWTQDGHMRHPVYAGLRVDKSADEVVIEIESAALKTAEAAEQEAVEPKGNPFATKPATRPKKKAKTTTSEEHRSSFSKEAPSRSKELTLNIHHHDVIVSNPSKILWPEQKLQKRDLVNYYQQMASYILPYLKDRPFVLNRFPNGIDESSFYQKDMTMPLPDWIETLSVYSESNQKDINYVLCQNEETLIWLANLGCIEMNPWNSRQQHLENPDWMVLDLDPEDIRFEKVIETAQVIHRILEEQKVPHYCKTSGATGLHIYVPLGAQYSYETAKHFGQLLAMLVNQELPKTTSLERSPAKRTKQIYLDFLQNRYGQTLVAPYSVRPTPQATVSTPLLWDEVKPGLKPTQFTLKNIQERVAALGDLWKPVLKGKVNLTTLLKKLST